MAYHNGRLPEGIYGDEIGAKEAETMMILISCTFICNYNGALTGAVNSNILGYLKNLSNTDNSDD